jgi:hypothetical protein
MATTYTIRVVNQSSANNGYAIFTQSPTVTSQTDAPQVFTNAWATFNSIADGGFDTITSDGVTFAHEGATPPHTVSSAAPLATTQTQDALTPGAGHGSSDSLLHAGPTPGAFAVAAPADFPTTHDLVFGQAHPGKTPVPSSGVTFSPMPNETFNITPVVKFYVSDGLYTAGQVIDVSTVSSTCAEIDFTGRPESTATIVQAADGSFSVTYG